MAPGTSSMLRARRRDVNVKPNRRLDRSSTRGMIYENEELRLRTININAEVERSQDDIKKLRRENDQLRRELWGLRDEYDKLEALLKRKQHGDESEEYSDEEDEEEGDGEEEEEEDDDGEEGEDGDEDGDDGAGGAVEAEQKQAAPDAGGAGQPPFRDRQVDFDMLSVVQEETENDQTDSQTGSEGHGASPITPRKKGVCFLLEPLPEHHAAPPEHPQPPPSPPHQQPQQQQAPVQLMCDQFLIGADGKPVRDAAGQFVTTADLARDPFQYPSAYGYATGTVVGGVLIPAVDPATGVPLTGLFQQDVFVDTEGRGVSPGSAAAPGVAAASLGFDGLVTSSSPSPDMAWARTASPGLEPGQELEGQKLLQPRGAADLFVDGAYPLGLAVGPGAGSAPAGVIEQLLRNINLGATEAADSAEVSERTARHPAPSRGVESFPRCAPEARGSAASAA
ncbi:hypothetical protein ONE63_009900 [Megalurothrips usitatus]|uniref:Uncharacterized protein n=1 Tax=Megalurothrips usitatus TaxID=439358 RepID=A0AAV7XKE7_9NEOP|nr:hypothetical protein ONE63_009900 [Megalurothrips usitatus]